MLSDGCFSFQMKTSSSTVRKQKIKTFRIAQIRIIYFESIKNITKGVNSICCVLIGQIPLYLTFLPEYIFQVELVCFFLIIPIKCNLIQMQQVKGLSDFGLKIVSKHFGLFFIVRQFQITLFFFNVSSDHSNMIIDD